MASVEFLRGDRQPRVVGSFGSVQDLQNTLAETARNSCDITEIRLDLLAENADREQPDPWQHLKEIPLLFTARRGDEGGFGALSAAARTARLRDILPQAACVDVEVASMDEMPEILAELAARRIPWIASHHNFDRLPPTADLKRAAERARLAGAAVFKVAAKLGSPADLARLADFQLEDHGIPVASMGMGPLAPVSRLLCAQCGSVLNYGFLGATATAPGQWDSALLKVAISQLAGFRL